MSRWIRSLWQALAVLGDDLPALNFLYPIDYRYLSDRLYRTPEQRQREFRFDTTDVEAVRAAFRLIVEREWGQAAFGDSVTPPPCPHPDAG
ncbi:hypothetical protein [Micromonospora sp. CB01531]|uniref:hypothetical protein n=1 Tax=Micromonospora sp. CB01531 TaxID=1718947 RepID=UPI00093A7764|nr:hypothetical protein [Micromonospora sp. CB01531]OKI49269.1 hypothetical protein A6A27_35125 [Micromonospora sp. CB01531]